MPDDQRNDAELLKRMRTAALDTAAQQLRLIYELKKGTSGRRGASPASGGNAAARGAAPMGASDVLYDLARLSLRNYEQWLRLGARHFDSIVDSFRHVAGKGKEDSGGGHPRLELKAAGRRGEVVKLRFALDNPSASKVEVRFSTPVFRAGEGGGLSALVAFHCLDDAGTPVAGGDLALEAGKSGRFALEIAIRADAKPDQYQGESSVLVGGRIGGLLAIAVEVKP
jgi:hypothetical protein